MWSEHSSLRKNSTQDIVSVHKWQFNIKMLLHCTVYKEICRSRSALNHHVRRLHQSRVKVRFASDEIKEIQKGADDLFQCDWQSISASTVTTQTCKAML